MTTAVDVAPVERVIEAIEGMGLRINRTASGHMAQCPVPAHDDRKPSLSISTGDDGRALLMCHAGCRVEDVIEALGLRWPDLHPDDDHVDTTVTQSAPPAAPCRHLYPRADGSVIGAVVRRSGKRFHQEHLVGVHWESGGCDELKKTPYRLPELLAAIAAGVPVLVVEGERDVDTAWSVGVAATCNAGGAGKWTPAHAAHLTGADVIVVRDQDDTGRKHAADVVESLRNVARSVRVVDPIAGKDWTDHVAAGYSVADLRPVDEHRVGRRLAVVRASTIRPRRLRWLWDGYVPLGELSLIAGREGLGKSTIVVDRAARVTRGDLPGEFLGRPRSVIYVATEDSRETTIVPRLMAAGADMERVLFVDVDDAGPASLVLPLDVEALVELIRLNDVALVVLDPATSAIDARLNGDRDREMRQGLEAIKAMAERTRCAVVGIVHFGKRDSSDTGKLILGSIAWSQVARSVVAVARDDESGELVISATKANLAPSDAASLGARIVEHMVDTDDGPAAVGRVEWTGPTDQNARDLLGGQEAADQRTERDEAADWLRHYLTENAKAGRRSMSADVKVAARASGITDRHLVRARYTLRVKAENEGFPRVTYWTLPSGDTDDHAGARESVTTVTTGSDQGEYESSRDSRDSGDAPNAPGTTDATTPVPLTGGCDVCGAEPAVTFADRVPSVRRCIAHNPLTYTGNDHVG